MTYTIDYYSPDIQEQILTLPDGLAGRYVILTKRMKQVGANLHEPHTKAMGDGLFELRLKASEGIARVFYCTLVVSASSCCIVLSRRQTKHRLTTSALRLNE